MDDQPKCADCRFFQKYSGQVGHCKRYPPTLYACDEDNSSNVAFPLLSKDEWCGDFQRNGWVYKGDAPNENQSR